MKKKIAFIAIVALIIIFCVAGNVGVYLFATQNIANPEACRNMLCDKYLDLSDFNDYIIEEDNLDSLNHYRLKVIFDSADLDKIYSLIEKLDENKELTFCEKIKNEKQELNIYKEDDEVSLVCAYYDKVNIETSKEQKEKRVVVVYIMKLDDGRLRLHYYR